MYPEYLMHYGVKGMRWRKRKKTPRYFVINRSNYKESTGTITTDKSAILDKGRSKIEALKKKTLKNTTSKNKIPTQRIPMHKGAPASKSQQAERIRKMQFYDRR